MRLETLLKRADFLAAANRGWRQGRPGMMVQGRRRGPEEAERVPEAGARVGFTCSKKVGNAVARNRAKRRLRAAARAILPIAARPGWDYVLIGRAEETAARDFRALTDDLERALARIHGRFDAGERPDRPPPPRGKRRK
ncbi:MAG: ribonuclease P protein component [Pseudomonadota bacterium]